MFTVCSEALVSHSGAYEACGELSTYVKGFDIYVIVMKVCHSTPQPSFVTRFGQNNDPPATTHRDREVVSMALAHSSKKPESKRTTARRAALRQNLDTIRHHDHRL